MAAIVRASATSGLESWPPARSDAISAAGMATKRVSSSSDTAPSRAAICSTPAASDAGYATPGFTVASNRIGLARSETKNPFTSSAGCVAHQPTTPTDSPDADATFQIAGTARERPEIGTFWPVAGSTSWKSRTRCTSGPTPVASVVHTMGERTGRNDSSRAE